MSHSHSSPENNRNNEVSGTSINDLVQGMFKYETKKILNYDVKIDSGVEGVMIKAMEGLFRVGVNFNRGQFMTAANDPEIPESPVIMDLIKGTTTHVASHHGESSNNNQAELAA